MEERKEGLPGLLEKAAEDEKLRRTLLAALLEAETEKRLERLARREAELKRQYETFRDLTHDEVIEMMNAHRCGSQQEAIDRVFFIVANYRRATELINSQARKDLRQDIRGCRAEAVKTGRRLKKLRELRGKRKPSHKSRAPGISPAGKESK